MRNKRLVNRLIKITERLCSVLRNSIPAYSCRKSKHKYKQYQHASILGLMKYLRTDYRGIIERLELMPRLQQVIGLNQLPHYTTIHKFFQRFKGIDRILSRTVNLFHTGNCIVAIDATGYSSNHASRYYVLRIGKDYSRRKHIKSSVTVDTGNQVIISQKARLGPRNDCLDSGKLLINTGKLVRVKRVVADKGYDSEENHRLVRELLNGIAIIPLRGQKPGLKMRGRYRRKSVRVFDEKIYHRRSLVETVFSVIKRLFGSWVKSRLLVNQIKEIGLMCVVYNVHRYVTKHISFIQWVLGL